VPTTTDGEAGGAGQEGLVSGRPPIARGERQRGPGEGEVGDGGGEGLAVVARGGTLVTGAVPSACKFYAPVIIFLLILLALRRFNFHARVRKRITLRSLVSFN
jgi:hypothetical protein